MCKYNWHIHIGDKNSREMVTRLSGGQPIKFITKH